VALIKGVGKKTLFGITKKNIYEINLLLGKFAHKERKKEV
jgi:hypothetical protein